MDGDAARKQLENIRAFILLEAKEKADEIRMKARGDADKERQELVLSAKNKIAEEYERKEKQLALDQRIKASMEERRQRSRLLEKRDVYVSELGKEAKAKLAAVASSNATAYGNLLKGLIKQGLHSLTGDSKVDVRCRPQDVDRIRTLAPAAAAEVVAELKAAGEERAVSITVTPDASLASSAGGVILSSLDGRIKCNNMLEERLKLVMGDLQPVIRDLLFPSARAEPRVKPAISIHGHSAAVGKSVPGEARAAAIAASRSAAAAAARAAAPALPAAALVPAAAAASSARSTAPAVPAAAAAGAPLHPSMHGVAATAFATAGFHHPAAAAPAGGAGLGFGAPMPAAAAATATHFDAWGSVGTAPTAAAASGHEFDGGWGAAPAAAAPAAAAGWGAPAAGSAANAFSF